MKLPYFLSKPLITLPLAGAFLFASQAPTEWATSEYWPASAVVFISALFPTILGYSKNSAFPDIAQMYMSFTFMLMPLHIWFSYKELSISRDEVWFKNLWSLDSNWAFIKRLLLVITICAIVIFTLFFNPGYDFNLMPLNSSRTALGIGGWIVAGGLQGSCIAWVYCNLIVFIRFFKE